MLVALDGAESFGSRIEPLLDRDAGFLAAAASEDSEAGRGYRYALSQLLPFAVTAGAGGFPRRTPRSMRSTLPTASLVTGPCS